MRARATPTPQDAMSHGVDIRQGLVGAAAGLVEACIMHPVDTVKTRMQARTVGGVRFTGVQDAFLRTLQEEGAGSFYKGLGPVVASVMPRVCFQYMGLSYFLPIARSITPSAVPASLHPSIAGVMTGVVQATVVVAPLELIKNRDQVSRSLVSQGGDAATRAKTGLFATGADVIKREGVAGLYKGLGATVLRQCWGLWIKFGCYIGIRDAMKARVDGELQPYHHMLAGGITNTFVGVLVSPFDVVKTRIQISRQEDALTIRGCVRGILKQEGWRTFFRGASMRVLRVAPGGAIQFATAECLATFAGVKIG